jgi:peptidoglycan/LPS O-acetylase OafA/YrhL
MIIFGPRRSSKREVFYPGVFAGIPVPVVNGSLWTLPYESVCYGLLAGTFVLFKDVRVGASLISSVCAVVILTGNGVQTPIFANVIVIFICELGPFFFAGVLIRLLNIRGNLYIDFAMCGWMAWALTTVSTDWRPFYEAQIIVIPYLTIRLAYMPFRPFAAVLDRHDISYGMYLYAFPMTQSVVTLIGTGHGVLLTTLVSVSATLPLALASWLLIERPALSLRRWLRRPGRDKTIDIRIAGRVKG